MGRQSIPICAARRRARVVRTSEQSRSQLKGIRIFSRARRAAGAGTRSRVLSVWGPGRRNYERGLRRSTLSEGPDCNYRLPVQRTEHHFAGALCADAASIRKDPPKTPARAPASADRPLRGHERFRSDVAFGDTISAILFLAII
ncbi:hypothetical protein EVAR_60976_1 [Eumeta japonica]|uniref:Uncharacterized protein n=1 Tax=Eumeta variegata TaxID=151549 RepID=A0A4C1XXB4_EUMVA|nr:hypothetical protein EVAR_60976_1 [Eumeta japonica]